MNEATPEVMFNAPREFTLILDGKPQTVFVRHHNLSEEGQLRQWIKDNVPSLATREGEAIKALCVDDRELATQLIREALLKLRSENKLTWPPEFGKPEFFEALGGIEGMLFCLYLALKQTERAANPMDCTPYVLEKANQDELTDLIQWFLIGETVGKRKSSASS